MKKWRNEVRVSEMNMNSLGSPFTSFSFLKNSSIVFKYAETWFINSFEYIFLLLIYRVIMCVSLRVYVRRVFAFSFIVIFSL